MRDEPKNGCEGDYCSLRLRCFLKNTAQFNFEIIVLSKESNLERSALCLVFFASADQLPLWSDSNNDRRVLKFSVIYSSTSGYIVYIILERVSVKGRYMEMSNKFCVMHLKYFNCVSLHIVESSCVIESPVFNHE